MASAILSTKGQASIPAAARALLGLKTGSRIEFVEAAKLMTVFNCGGYITCESADFACLIERSTNVAKCTCTMTIDSKAIKSASKQLIQ